MRYWKLKLCLVVILLALIALKSHVKNTYPLSHEKSERDISMSEFPKYKDLYIRLMEDRFDNEINPFLWDPTMTLGKTDRELPWWDGVDTLLRFNGDAIQCKIIHFGGPGILNAVKLRMPYDEELENVFVKYFGKEHIYRHSPYAYDSGYHGRLWLTSDSLYVKIEKSYSRKLKKQCLYFHIGSAPNDLSEKSIVSLATNTTSDDWFGDDVKKEKKEENTYQSSKTYSSSRKTYKYGDSDTYQGSAQQKADLAAIDAYGASHPEFW